MLFSILCWALCLYLCYKFARLDCSLQLLFYDKFYPNKDRLRNKTVWLVGGSTGIGEELALQLAELECKLILTATSAGKLEEVKAACLKRSKSLQPNDILVLPYDITNFDENAAAFKKIIETYGNIDVLVANAARVYAADVAEEDFAKIKQLFDVNFFSHLFTTKIVLRHWLANGFRGQILVTSSIASICEFPFGSPYVATKRALNTFYRDVSMQYSSRGISVTNCFPGPVESSLIEKRLIEKEREVNDNPFVISMATERCAHLMLVSLANRISETYISMQPFLIFTYFFFDYYCVQTVKALGLTPFIEKHFFPKEDSKLK